MDDYHSFNHTKWECKYHVVFIPKCRRKILYGGLRSQLGSVFGRLRSRRRAGSRKGT
jgi:putative transposase